MQVYAQQISTGMFLNTVGMWVEDKDHAREFRNSVTAIAACVAYKRTDVRLVIRTVNPEREIYFYPFGEDPGRLELRGAVHENRRLREEQRALREELDLAIAEGKERKKQVPFKRKQVGKDERTEW